MHLKYFTLDEIIGLIDEPNKSACHKLLDDNKELLMHARGSKTKHQAWEGGYLDHVAETCNIGLAIYDALNSARTLPFSKSDVVLVMFLHDLEKPWKHAINAGKWTDTPELDNKEKMREFVVGKMKAYGLQLNDQQLNALRYVEGEIGDYDPYVRKMGELGAVCHCADILSARLWYNHPTESSDSWHGAYRNLKS